MRRGLQNIAQQLLDIAERDIKGTGAQRPVARQVTGWST